MDDLEKAVERNTRILTGDIGLKGLIQQVAENAEALAQLPLKVVKVEDAKAVRNLATLAVTFSGLSLITAIIAVVTLLVRG